MHWNWIKFKLIIFISMNRSFSQKQKCRSIVLIYLGVKLVERQNQSTITIHLHNTSNGPMIIHMFGIHQKGIPQVLHFHMLRKSPGKWVCNIVHITVTTQLYVQYNKMYTVALYCTTYYHCVICSQLCIKRPSHHTQHRCWFYLLTSNQYT